MILINELGHHLGLGLGLGLGLNQKDIARIKFFSILLGKLLKN